MPGAAAAEAAAGEHLPDNVPLGASFMLFNCFVSAMVQIVNKKIMRRFPLFSTSVLIEAFAVLFLAFIAAFGAPAGSWWIDGSVVLAVMVGGVFATAMNNWLLARANIKMG